MTRALAILLVFAAGCTPILYYGFPKTRTYTYERRVPVVIDSDPAGATIIASDGTVLGQAPVMAEEVVRVTRSNRQKDESRALAGCLVDAAALIAGVFYWYDNQDTTVGKAAFATGAAMSTGCIGVAIMKGANIGTDPASRSFQATSMFASAQTNDEHVIESTIEVTARWDGVGEARQTLVLPLQRSVTIQLPRTYTFEEAHRLWQRTTKVTP